jgi:hypothetical protein
MKQIVLALSLVATGAAAAQTPPARPLPAARPIPGDADRSGVLTRAEAIARANAQFSRLDTDHDGTLTPDERTAAMPMRSDRGEGAGGPRADRTMTAAEYRDRALRRFDRADTNHDGRLDPAERQAQRDAMRDRRDRMQGDAPPPPPAPPPAQ